MGQYIDLLRSWYPHVPPALNAEGCYTPNKPQHKMGPQLRDLRCIIHNPRHNALHPYSVLHPYNNHFNDLPHSNGLRLHNRDPLPLNNPRKIKASDNRTETSRSRLALPSRSAPCENINRSYKNNSSNNNSAPHHYKSPPTATSTTASPSGTRSNKSDPD